MDWAVQPGGKKKNARALFTCMSVSGSDGRDSLGYVPDDGIETLPPGLPLPDPDRTGIEQGLAGRVLAQKPEKCKHPE